MIEYFGQCEKQLGWNDEEAKRFLDLIAPNIIDSASVDSCWVSSGLEKSAFDKAVRIFMQSTPSPTPSDRRGVQKAPTTGEAATVNYPRGYELNSDDGFGFYWYMRLIGGPNYISARKDGTILYDFTIEYFGRNVADTRKPRLRVYGINAVGEVIWRGINIEGSNINLRHEGHFEGQKQFAVSSSPLRRAMISRSASRRARSSA